jgi:hypothetical protein
VEIEIGSMWPKSVLFKEYVNSMFNKISIQISLDLRNFTPNISSPSAHFQI